ncbi:prophage tail length tape measure protein, partial [Cooperia oncophora]
QQIRQARNSGGIAQQDYLALISEVTAKTRVLTQEEETATRQKTAFIRQLKEQTSRQKMTTTELLRAKAAQLGCSSAAEVYIRKMEKAGNTTHSLGLKSAAARRELGVMIGELARGNFGALRGSGITLANRAGWIDKLMTPKGLAVGGVIGGITAAVIGLGKAWMEGQEEGEAFNRQLELTGHYAGVTAGQLWALSKNLSGNGITQHAMAGSLAQVVGSGAFHGNDIGMVAKAAAQMERSVGQSVSDTISQFKRLKDDPVSAAKALDDELHFLTATQLEQIRVLGEQGRTSDAARIAMSALAVETGKRTSDIDNNLNALGSTLQTLSDCQQQAQVEGQIAAARQSAGMATERMTEAHKQLLALQQRISDLAGKKLTADEKSVLAHKDELIQALTLLDAKQQELQKQTALNDLKKKTIQLTSQLAEEERAQRQQHDLDVAMAGMGDQQRQRYQSQLRLRQQYQQQLEQLERDSKQKGSYGSDAYRKAEQTLTDSLNRKLNENRRYWQQMDAAQGEWRNGTKRAFMNFTADADNAAGTAEQMFMSAFSSMGNGLATFVTTGKLNFKSFTSSVLSDMAKILAQATMMKAVKGIGSVMGFDFGDVKTNAEGGVYQSADLSRYSGTVVNRPTFFAFAKGAGVMGEAGPEAILPLRRG